MKIATYLLALTVVISGSALAQEKFSRGYIGVGFGNTKSSIRTNNLTNPDVCTVVGSACSVDNKDSSHQIYGGINLSPRISIEGTYTDLGVTGSVTDGTIRGVQSTKGLSLSVLGKVPLSRALSLYGKAGVYRWDTDTTIGARSNSAKGADVAVGLGLEYRMGRRVSARLGWDRYNNVGNKNAMLDAAGAHTFAADVDVYSVGIQYNF